MSDADGVNTPLHYSMHIAWSEQDHAYLITLPEWSSRLLNSIAVTHGATYEEAARNGARSDRDAGRRRSGAQ